MRIGVSNSWTDAENEIADKLRSYRPLVAKYKACLALYNDLFPSTTTHLKEVPITGSGENMGETKVIRVVDLRLQMRKDLERQLAEINKIKAMLDVLDPEEQAILTRLYFLGQRIQKISLEMYRSESSCWKLRRRALKKLVKAWVQ
jgi:DNA-directed RNA polymerase specialized sigma24 family protein